jgi:nucleoside-diphosphate-sugar epimerase
VTTNNEYIIKPTDSILITGAGGFVGSKVVETLLQYGFKNLRCFIRSSRNLAILQVMADRANANIEIVKGNLLLPEDCKQAVKDISVIYHLAIGSGGKSFPNNFMNAVIPTRNLLDACIEGNSLKRFVNISSFAIYSNQNTPRWRLLDESCPIDEHPELRADAYAFAKLKQDQLIEEYGRKHNLPYVIVRLSYVYGAGKDAIPGRVGIDTFGIFLHLGGLNRIALTYIDNCADAIVLAGIVKGADGEIFNVVDDNLPSSRRFLKLYKKKVKKFRSIYIPHGLSYLLCYLWEKYSIVSKGQLPPILTRNEWHAYWKQTRYNNNKIKNRLGWTMKVPTEEGLNKFFDYCRERINNA